MSGTSNSGMPTCCLLHPQRIHALASLLCRKNPEKAQSSGRRRHLKTYRIVNHPLNRHQYPKTGRHICFLSLFLSFFLSFFLPSSIAVVRYFDLVLSFRISRPQRCTIGRLDCGRRNWKFSCRCGSFDDALRAAVGDGGPSSRLSRVEPRVHGEPPRRRFPRSAGMTKHPRGYHKCTRE
jgi:hypothetical protein